METGTRSWNEAERFIHSGSLFGLRSLDELHALLDRSSTYLTPLGDPLRIDFGAHRWLRREREEAYSDWLAWIIGQLEEPEWVLPLFGLNRRSLIASCSGKLTVEREVRVYDGERRLDLLIKYGRAVLIVVEVKVTSAEGAELLKNREYGEWAQTQDAIEKLLVVLVTEGAFREYEGFTVHLWEHVCIYLRKLTPMLLRRRGVMVAALTLAFVGAVETNLLSLSRIGESGEMSPFLIPRTLAYLQRAHGPEEVPDGRG